MKYQKTKEELELMKKAGNICAQALQEVVKHVKEGIECRQLDDIARQKIESLGAKSSFMTVDDYKWTICTTINDQVVHGIPTSRKLQDGEIIGIDIGALYKGYHSDQATTVAVGQIPEKTKEFLETGLSTLKKAIAQAKAGNHIGDVAATIQENIEAAGYGIVRNLTGHGIGRELHEDPMVPGFGKPGKGFILEKDMTLAIEVIYTQGSGEVVLESDNWTISSKDGTLGGLYEQTIAVSNNEPIILTPYL